MANIQGLVSKTRTIELILDLETFPKWVAEESEEMLLEVFRLGVAVRDSVTMRFSASQKYVDEVLERKLDPVYQKVDKMVEKFSQQAEMVRGLKPEVESVSEKVQTQIRDTQSDLSQKLRYLEDGVNRIASLHEKPTTKGAIGERKVLSVLKVGLPSYCFTDVSSRGRQGDIHVESPTSSHKYLLEVKNYQKVVTAAEIEKFEKNVRENADFKVGILFSLKSGIAGRALHGRFQIKFKEDQYLMYVPNAIKDENLIIWSVLLADELANLEHDLSVEQVEIIEGLRCEFQDSMERSKKCKENLKVLKRTVHDIEVNLEPLIKIIGKAKNDLNRALHAKSSRRSNRSERTTQTRLDNVFDEAKQKYGKRSRTESPVSPRSDSQTIVESGSLKENEENIAGTRQKSHEEAEKSTDNAGSNTQQTSPSFPGSSGPPLVTIDDD